jgi:hypothetical protein
MMLFARTHLLKIFEDNILPSDERVRSDYDETDITHDGLNHHTLLASRHVERDVISCW